MNTTRDPHADHLITPQNAAMVVIDASAAGRRARAFVRKAELAQRWRPYRSPPVSYLSASHYDGGI